MEIAGYVCCVRRDHGAVFGQTPAGIHIGVLVMNAITTLLMFLLARRFFGAFAFGSLRPPTYGLLSTSPAVLGFGGVMPLTFVVFFAIAGLLLLFGGLEKGKLMVILQRGLLAECSLHHEAAQEFSSRSSSAAYLFHA